MSPARHSPFRALRRRSFGGCDGGPRLWACRAGRCAPPLVSAPSAARRTGPLALARRAVILAAPLLAAALLRLTGCRFNTSPSLPLGLYRLDARPLARGLLVLACPPPAAAALAHARGYLPRGTCPGGVQPLGKILLAIPGDTVELGPRGLSLNGRLFPCLRPAARDTLRRPLPRWPPGSHRLGPGEVFLVSPHPRSFDSRVFGAVPVSSLRGVVIPLWTAGPPDLRPLAAALRRLSPATPAEPDPRTTSDVHR